MSIGLARLREEPDRDPAGRDRQGRGPLGRRRGPGPRGPPPPAARRVGRPQGRAQRRVQDRSAKRSAAAPRPTVPRSPRSGRLPPKPARRSRSWTPSWPPPRAQLEELLLRIPNPADPDVPVGDASANQIVRTWGEPLPQGRSRAGRRGLGAPAALGSRRRACACSTSSAAPRSPAPASPSTPAPGSRLQRALIDFMLDVHTAEHGMTEIWPPALVNAASARGTGQIPDKEDLMYVVPRDDLYLVPTAEVPVTNLHRDEIFEADQLPHPLRRLLALLPPRGRRGRQGHPRHPARPPVRQGRDGLLREARSLRPRRSNG